MLNSKGFDLWADDYDKSVGISDEDGIYPLFPNMKFEPMSYCAGLFSLKK